MEQSSQCRGLIVSNGWLQACLLVVLFGFLLLLVLSSLIAAILITRNNSLGDLVLLGSALVLGVSLASSGFPDEEAMLRDSWRT